MDSSYLRLRQIRMRATSQRLAILRTLATGSHLATCQEIWERARTKCRNLGLVTVYRTLARLHDARLVEQIDLDGVAHFGLAVHHHDHAICQRCGAAEATDTCLLAPLEGVRLGGGGFLVTGHRLEVFGVCRACQSAR